MMMRDDAVRDISPNRRLLSYLYPVLINESNGDHIFRLYLIRDQFVLATDETTYSDGNRYLPAVMVANELKAFLPSVKNVLVLGTGLGSIVRVFHKNGFRPDFTLVENDGIVLDWAMNLFEAEGITGLEPVLGDALKFMEQTVKKHDLIFVDIFNSRKVPDFVMTTHFLDLCINNLSDDGCLAVNYLADNLEEWKAVKQLFTNTFNHHKELVSGDNRVFIVHKAH